jgi:hypothetical protein
VNRAGVTDMIPILSGSLLATVRTLSAGIAAAATVPLTVTAVVACGQCRG